MSKSIAMTDKAPKPLADYSHAWVVDSSKLIYVSGQVSVDISGSLLGPDNMALQAETALENLKKVLEGAGAKMSDVFKLNIYVTHMSEFHTKTKEVRTKYFPKDFPASTLVEVKSLADPGFMIEIEAIAAIG
jgi:2-iminobutanoate/2-iminopropanoate deaminase